MHLLAGGEQRREPLAVFLGPVGRGDERLPGALGPAEFRPKLALDWYSRGENAAKDRRTELRRVAVTRINAMAKEAQVQMETKALDGLELLARTALESAEAQRFLASIPTVEVLMPALDVAQLGPLALSQSDPDDELDIETPPVDDEE